MAYSYVQKKQAGTVSSQAMPENVQKNLQAMQNVDLHAGHKLNLENSLKSRIEQQTGFRMDNVELRESSQAADMDAKAFAKGNVVHFAPGQFDQSSEAGRQLITHELTHVAQQARGGVHADVFGLNVNASESLESQADHGMSPGGGALQDLPSMNAEAAPIQGLFGGIKKFFKKAKNSFKAGQLLRAKDKAVASVRADHDRESAEMEAAMAAQGFSPEEMEAQRIYQRMNRADEYGERIMSKQGDIIDFGSNITDPNMMTNTFAKMGRGVFSKSKEASLARREQETMDVAGFGNEDRQRERELTASIGQKYANRNAAQGVFDRMGDVVNRNTDVFNAAAARYKQRSGKTMSMDSGQTEYMRFLNRNLHGKSEADQDSMVDDFMSMDTARIAPHLKSSIDTFMANADISKLDDSADDSTFLGSVADQTLLGQDNMSVSDIVKRGLVTPEQMGMSAQEYEAYTKKKMAHGAAAGKARMRLKGYGAAPR